MKNKVSDQIYKKIGRRYVPIGPLEYSWFPTDGIWLVQVKPNVHSQECILKLGELPSLYPYANIYMDKASLVKLIMEKTKVSYSVDELATSIIKWLTTLAESRKEK